MLGVSFHAKGSTRAMRLVLIRSPLAFPSKSLGRRTRACWMPIRWYLRELYNQPKVALSLKTRAAKVEAIEALLHGCSKWTRRQEHYSQLRTAHQRVLLRIIEAQRKRSDYRMTSYNVPPTEVGVLILRPSWAQEDLLGGGLWPR